MESTMFQTLTGVMLLSIATSASGSSTGSMVKTIFEKKDFLVEKHETYQHRRLAKVSDVHPTILNPTSNKNLRDNNRHLGEREGCDVAYVSCLYDSGCMDCIAQLELQNIDWTGVTPTTTCDDVVKTLNEKGHCLLVDNSQSTEVFCKTFRSCVVWENFENNNDDLVPNEGDDGYVNCTALTTCDWPGKHDIWIGDGVCHDNLHGCYNTEICGWDGGDCCEDTCGFDPINYVECGHDGFACRDPTSSNCDSTITKFCPEYDDDDENYDYECAEHEAPYRLIMYDSFGDGWDNTKVKITTKDQKKIIFDGGLEDGSMGTEYICLSKDPSCYYAFTGGGVWGVESSWEIKALKDGSPAIAGSGAPNECDFPVSGDACEKTCEGRPDVDPTNDPEYKSFKDLFTCVENKCLIQYKKCETDYVCAGCFVEDTPDYCFGNDYFVAMIDCSVCACTEIKNGEYCAKKPSDTNYPPYKRDKDLVKQCTSAETKAGAKAVMDFSRCSEIDQMVELITEFDQENFGMLDSFETCAHSFADEDNHGGRTALGCMQILYNAMTHPTVADKPDAPKEAISALARHIYNEGETFCDCAKSASEDCPLCPSFQKFKTLLYESMDACKALDEIDCDSWNEFWKPCKDNLERNFEIPDFSSNDQCEYAKYNCGGVGTFPAFRRLDCGDELDKEAWDFYRLFSDKCLKGDDGKAPTKPPSEPAPSYAPVPTTRPPVDTPTDMPVGKPTPKPYIPPDAGPHTPYTPAPIVPAPADSPTPYVPSGQQSSTAGGSTKKGSRFFRTFFILALLAGGGYVVYKRRFDTFSFIQYRRRRANGGAYNMMYSGGNDMYDNLNSSTTFEPPTLPPMMGTEMT